MDIETERFKEGEIEAWQEEEERKRLLALTVQINLMISEALWLLSPSKHSSSCTDGWLKLIDAYELLNEGLKNEKNPV